MALERNMNISSNRHVNDKDISDILQRVGAPQFHNDYTKPLLVTMLVVIALASLCANALIIHVVRANKSKNMRTTSNYFIVNMAFGDTIASAAIAFVAIKYMFVGLEWSDGILGQISCKMVMYIETVSIFWSVFSLVALTFDRFLAVVYPLQYKCCFSWTKCIIPAIWIASLALPAHLIFANIKVGKIEILNNNKTYILAKESAREAIILASLGYVLPHVAMVIMYVIIAYKLWTRRMPGTHVQDDPVIAARQKTARRITGMIVCILFVFNLCWFPTFFMMCIVYFMKINYKYHDAIGLSVFSMTAIVNGPLNAVIYNIFCQNIRTEFKSTLRFFRCKCCHF